jgi:hypothetical protein
MREMGGGRLTDRYNIRVKEDKNESGQRGKRVE